MTWPVALRRMQVLRAFEELAACRSTTGGPSPSSAYSTVSASRRASTPQGCLDRAGSEKLKDGLVKCRTHRVRKALSGTEPSAFGGVEDLPRTSMHLSGCAPVVRRGVHPEGG